MEKYYKRSTAGIVGGGHINPGGDATNETRIREVREDVA